MVAKKKAPDAAPVPAAVPLKKKNTATAASPARAAAAAAKGKSKPKLTVEKAQKRVRQLRNPDKSPLTKAAVRRMVRRAGIVRFESTKMHAPLVEEFNKSLEDLVNATVDIVELGPRKVVTVDDVNKAIEVVLGLQIYGVEEKRTDSSRRHAAPAAAAAAAAKA